MEMWRPLYGDVLGQSFRLASCRARKNSSCQIRVTKASSDKFGWEVSVSPRICFRKEEIGFGDNPTLIVIVGVEIQRRAGVDDKIGL